MLATERRRRRAGRAAADRARGARLDARRAVAHRPGDRLRRRPGRGGGRAPDARRGRSQPRGPLRRGAAARDGAALVAAVDGLRSLGLSAAGTLEEMAALLQQMAVVQAVPERARRRRSRRRGVARLAALLPADETQLLYSMVLAGRAELALAPDEYSGLVMVLLRMLAFAPADDACRRRRRRRHRRRPPPRAGDPARATERAKRRRHRPLTPAAPPASPPAVADRIAEPSPRAVAAAAAPTIAGSAAADRWTALVQRLVDAGASRRWCASSRCRPNASRSSTTTASRSGSCASSARTCARRLARAAAGGGAAGRGRAVRIEIEAGARTTRRRVRDAAERARRQAEAEQMINDDPLVQALMAQYKTARIVPVGQAALAPRSRH